MGQRRRPGNISYYHNPDELVYLFKYTTADSKQKTLNLFLDPNGDFRGPDGRVFGQLIKSGAKAGVVISIAALTGDDTEDRRLCPAHVNDNHGDRGVAYEDYAKALLNPENPTPSKIGYAFTDPTGKIVKIDDCQQTTGNPYEYKGPNYEHHFISKSFISGEMKKDFLEQSSAQLKASQGHPLTWVFAEKGAAVETAELFEKADAGRESINIAVWPWREGAKK